MALATLYSRMNIGLDAPLVCIEVDISFGLYQFAILGLSSQQASASKARIKSAIINSGFSFPSKKITVNLAPCDLPKYGARFDLAIAVGILLADGQCQSSDIEQYELVAELSLSGRLLPCSGALSIIKDCQAQGRQLIVASQHHQEMGLFASEVALCANSLKHVVAHLSDNTHNGYRISPLPALAINTATANTEASWDMIKGQFAIKSALVLAASGGHNLLLYGPPGTGKTTLAKAFADILPPLDKPALFDMLCIHSIALQPLLLDHTRRPVVMPHHGITHAAFFGGGIKGQPGAISMAHHGVLILDELSQFKQSLLDQLRGPLQDKHIFIQRHQIQSVLPADFRLIATLNPTPTGDTHNARSSIDQVARYLHKLSDPLLERIDMQCEVPKIPLDALTQQPNYKLASAQTQVCQAQARQYARQACLNSQLSPDDIERYCPLDEASQRLLSQAIERFSLSLRVSQTCRKIARTIADIHDRNEIVTTDIAQALQYRSFDKFVNNLHDYL